MTKVLKLAFGHLGRAGSRFTVLIISKWTVVATPCHLISSMPSDPIRNPLIGTLTNGIECVQKIQHVGLFAEPFVSSHDFPYFTGFQRQWKIVACLVMVFLSPKQLVFGFFVFGHSPIVSDKSDLNSIFSICSSLSTQILDVKSGYGLSKGGKRKPA